MNVLAYVFSRLKEPSTWAGLAVFAGMFGFSPDFLAKLTTSAPAAIAAIGSLVAILLPELAKHKTPPA